MHLSDKELIALAMLQNNSAREYVEEFDNGSFISYVINFIKHLFERR